MQKGHEWNWNPIDLALINETNTNNIMYIMINKIVLLIPTSSPFNPTTTHLILERCIQMSIGVDSTSPYGVLVPVAFPPLPSPRLLLHALLVLVELCIVFGFCRRDVNKGSWRDVSELKYRLQDFDNMVHSWPRFWRVAKALMSQCSYFSCSFSRVLPF